MPIRLPFRLPFRLAGLGVTAALLAACSTIGEQGEVVPKLQAPAAPRFITETTSSAEHKRMVALFGGEYRNPAIAGYLNGILAKFAASDEAGGRAYRVTILNTPIVNAFALPSGDIFVTRGLLALANDGSEVAAVMAHEIAHITERHAVAREEEERRAAVVSKVAHLVQNKQRGDEIEALGKLSIAGFSRQQELQADQRGIQTIAKVGYDPYGASRFLQALNRSSALKAALMGQASASKPDILATHPSTPDRIAAAVKVARGFGAPDIGARERDAYLQVIDGLPFGDDPAEGTVRGRRFIQPRLGFTFTAPEGFVLENSTQAVLGIKDGGIDALRLDSVAKPDGMSLDAYVRSGWIEGLLDSSVEPIEVNGLPAVTALARSGEWNFRIAAIGNGDTIYRVIFATHGLDPAQEKAFRAAFDSFRRISPAEAEKVKPLRITVVAAKPGDTPASLSSRMVSTDKPLETFELLNGLEGSAALKPGERYKLVTE